MSSGTVTECRGGTSTGCERWWGECLPALPKAEAAPDTVRCLKYVCLTCQGIRRRSRHPEPPTHAHLPSPSSHKDRHLFVRPWIRVRASGD